MNGKKMSLYYDIEADILEITIGEPSPCDFDEIDEGIFEGRDIKSNELKGYKIFSFIKRGGMRNVRIPLPAKVVIE